jgi:hypothetical protein
MVRGSSVASLDSGPQSLDYGEKPLDAPARAGLAEKPLRNGGGDRWLPIRLKEPSTANGTAATPSPPTLAFPVSLGSAYALQFRQVYLKFSRYNALERARQPAAGIPANARTRQSEFGWNSAMSLTLDSGQIAGIDVRGAHTAVVTRRATVNGRLIELGVPLYVSGSGIVVSGKPAWLPYASGDRATLNRSQAPGASVGGHGGAVSFGSIASLVVPRGGATRGITVAVNWVLAGQVNQAASQLAATYDMSVVDQRSGRWYVRDIRASTQPTDGDPMIRFTSSLVVPCGMRAAEGACGPAMGPRHLGQLTDVHGREG